MDILDIYLMMDQILLTILVELNVVDIGLFVEEVDPRRSSNESCPFEVSEMNKRKTNK